MNPTPRSANPPKIRIVQGDITEMEVDAIVNAANNRLWAGGGVCGAIFRKAGPGLPEACAKIGTCETGQAVITPGFALKAKTIIHTVGPTGSDPNRQEKLAACYLNSLKLALKNRLNSIAFPAISTGIYGYPLVEATEVAVQSLLDFLCDNPDAPEVILVAFDQATAEVLKSTYQRLTATHEDLCQGK